MRLAGCPLECRWCDTAYARDAASGTEMTVEEVVATVLGFGLPSVLVTGGEPLAQEGAGRLLSALADAGMDVMLETSGALDIRTVDPRVRRIVDIKCPSSGMTDRNLDSNLRELRSSDEVKFVIADWADYEWAREVVHREALEHRCTVLFSPVAGRMDATALAERMIADRLPVRLQIQLHRVLWPDRDRGV
ncbi:MAG: radical SAM protein [Myxococcota bacterium]|nr:radical SAM protein [Myxococcota bacterium]